MVKVYFLNIRNGELRDADGAYVSTFPKNNACKAIQEAENVGYSFMQITESLIFFRKQV